MTLKAAIIGTGVISEQHLNYLQSSQHARAVALCDLSPAAGRFTAERFGVEKVFTNHKEMLESTDIDVVHVLTPPQTHQMLAADCLGTGRHVIVEKPVALGLENYNELCELADSRHRRIVESHNYRFNEPIRTIRKLVDDDVLGEVKEVEVRMALGVRNAGSRYADRNLPHPSHQLPCGVIHEFITHLSYLTLHFLGSYSEVKAAWRNHGGGDIFKYDDLDALLIGDDRHGRIRFSCTTNPNCFAVTVRGTKGWAETDLFQPYVRAVVPRKGGDQLSPLINHLANGFSLARASVANFRNKIMQKSPYEGLSTMLEETYTALATDGPLPITRDEIAASAKLIDDLLAEENQI